jgi:hypothetical protein
MFACLSATRLLSDASRDVVCGRGVVGRCRAFFFALTALFFAMIPTVAQASCGKGYVVMPRSQRGAVVEAIVTKHRKAYAEQTNPWQTPVPTCSGPGCHDHAPVPYNAPLVRARTKTKIDAAHEMVKDVRDRDAVLFVRDPDHAIYFFEVAPPPTPPPNSSLS